MLPPGHAGFDCQLGGPHIPPAGAAAPAPGLCNICYVNAFRAQPGAEGEEMLDVHADAERKWIARKVNAWIDACAAKGCKAIDPDEASPPVMLWGIRIRA
ncbi:endo alpha-1,4 polygalactosaminidase [Streptomyces sp. NPDC001709]